MAKVGSSVTNVAVGDRVALEPGVLPHAIQLLTDPDLVDLERLVSTIPPVLGIHDPVRTVVGDPPLESDDFDIENNARPDESDP